MAARPGAEVPAIEIGHTETPSPLNPLGIKGVGEGGTPALLPGARITARS